MDRLHNPFTPGAGSLPPELAGRSLVIEDGQVLAGRTLMGRYEKSLLLIGLRGVGKTVLLKHLAESARQNGVLPIQVEVRNAKSDMEELTLRLREALSELDYAEKAKAQIHHAFSVLRNFVKSFSINIGDFGIAIEATAGVATSGKMELDLSEVLIAVAKAAKSANRAIGLYIDELQNLELEAMRGIIVAIHQSAQNALPFYLVGSGLPSIRGLVGKSKTYAERMFNYADIGALSEPDVDAAITIPLNGNGLDIEREAIHVIYEQTCGYPYFLQEYGYQLWLSAQEKLITKTDVDAIVDDVRRRLDVNFFDVRFDRVSNQERRFLRAMADGEGAESVPVADVAARLNRTLSSISPVRSSLIRKGMLYSPSHGRVAYTVPLFGDYIKRVVEVEN